MTLLPNLLLLPVHDARPILQMVPLCIPPLQGAQAQARPGAKLFMRVP